MFLEFALDWEFALLWSCKQCLPLMVLPLPSASFYLRTKERVPFLFDSVLAQGTSPLPRNMSIFAELKSKQISYLQFCSIFGIWFAIAFLPLRNSMKQNL